MSGQARTTGATGELSPLYAGWPVLAAAFVGVMVSFAPIVPYTFSLFLDPLHNAFGWQRQSIGGAFALAAITVALVSPLIGLLLDRFPPRRVILPAIVVFAAALLSLAHLGADIRRFYVTFFVMGLVANGTAQFAYTRTIFTWFSRHRGLALALLLTGSGVGSIALPPATQWFITHHGWRSGYLFLGVVALLGLPLTALLVRNHSETRETNAAETTAGVSVRTALRRLPFWVLATITMLSAFSENGLVTNMAAMLHDHGLGLSAAALALSVRGGTGILARLGTGFLIDRFPAQRVQTLILLLAAAGTLVLAFAGTSPVALLGAALLGAGLGSEADIVPYLYARYFGRRNFSVLYGLNWTAYAVGGATGPLVIGHLYDRHGTYEPRYIVGLAGVALLAVLVSLLLRTETPAVEDTLPTDATLLLEKIMPHIALPENMPGITAGFAFRPETAKPMRELAHVLLHTSGHDGFSSRDRELIATFVSSRNTCYFCQTSHGAAATHLHGGDGSLVEQVVRDYRSAPISDKLKALLAIAEQVQIDGKRVTPELIRAARAHGATDLDIHDTVLIAAAFCMYNRYVDGLATMQPVGDAMYREMGSMMAEHGYSRD